MQLYWGVTPMLQKEVTSIEEMLDVATTAAKQTDFVQTGDTVVVTGGVPMGKAGVTNIMKIVVVE